MKAILLECDLCGGKMASTAIACPHCGNPNSAHTPTLPQPTNTAGKRTKKMTRRADRRYETTISTGKYNPDTGELIVVHVYGKTKAEFENNKAKVRDALNRGTYASDKGHTVASWAKVWYETYKPGNKNYDNIIRNHFELINKIRLKNLTKTDVQKQINALDGHYDLQRRVKMTLNQMLEVAIDDGLVYKNVCRTASLPKKPRPNKRALTDYELKAIRNAEFTAKERAFIDVLYYLGVRRGEALALRKNSFDFNKGMVHIENAISFNNNTSSLGDTKTFAGNRYIDLIDPFKTTIKAYIDSIDTFYLFPTSKGSMPTESSFDRMWEQIMLKINAAAGGKQHYDNKKKKKWIIDVNAVPGLTPHIFRHNYATNLYYAGVDMKEAQRLLGHADAKTVIEIYTHLDKQKSKSTVKIEEYFQKISV